MVINKVRPRPERIAYIDLYAGKGEFKDGTASTPLMILGRAISDPQLCEKAVTIFNDADADFVGNLKEAAERLDGYKTLAYEPKFYADEVGDEIAEMFERLQLVPTLLFVDPWGYKGLSLRLINSVLKHHASEVIFFFNYRRINAAISNHLFADHVDRLFELERANDLRRRVEGKDPRIREKLVINAVTEALKADYAKYVLPFRFWNDNGTRITHHLIFVTKHPLGLHLMKDIMAQHSTGNIDGVPTYEFNLARARGVQLMLGHVSPILRLADDLRWKFAGKTMTMKDIYFAHHVNKFYIKSNYKRALLNLETRRLISVAPDTRVRTGTMPDKALITFRPS